ncbi:MDR family MFS transporter [Novosphingobium terrae]|uniref:MDR family MFS transporter n=1 Tax=Novosphingobium terrae TaxID=2726189 RepID=UPI001F14127C|nr:MDR family MFS transporter [Novosphingobium terrae]
MSTDLPRPPSLVSGTGDGLTGGAAAAVGAPPCRDEADAPPAAAVSEAPVRVVGYRTMAIIIASALFMEFLDATVLSTALPTMARDFHVRAPDMSVALTSYLLALAIFIPASGRLADRFGARTVFRTAIMLFMAGSVGCGLAPTLEAMVAARFVQGLGGAMMIPVGRLVLLRSVDKADMVDAMSWLMAPAMIGPILGPPLGGLIVTWLDWRWIFYINLPMAVLAVWLVGRYIPDIRDDVDDPFDWLGFALSGIALGCLLFGCEFVSRSGQAWLAVLLLALGTATGTAYLRHAQGNPAAILDLTLLKDETFRLSVIAGAITRVTQGAQPFLLPLMMQLSFGFSAARSGTITVATACGSLAMKSMAPGLLRRFGFRQALVWNGVIATCGYAICGLFSSGWSDWAMFGVLVVCGMSMSFQFTAYNTIAYAGIEKDAMSRATAFYATFQQLMLSLGICAGAMALHGAMLIDGHARPLQSDFSAAFWVVCTVSLTATIWNLRFAPDAGDEISGHGLVRD